MKRREQKSRERESGVVQVKSNVVRGSMKRSVSLTMIDRIGQGEPALGEAFTGGVLATHVHHSCVWRVASGGVLCRRARTVH